MDASLSVAPGGVAAFDFAAWSARELARVEDALDRWVSADAPAGLGEAMRYAVLGGGKRLRPLLALAACEAVRGNDEAGLRAACAAELIHAYSLVHDDLPCMDDDRLRRGKPTVHVRFGEAQALLAGDALQALAFGVLTPDDASVPPAMQAALCRLLSRAAGHRGMAGGQAIDLASVGKSLDEEGLRDMHSRKTGELLRGCVLMGAVCAAVPVSEAARQSLSDYGEAMGLAFQVVDDILDVTADSATLGKTAGKDAANSKPTYVSVLGLERSRQLADELFDRAMAALSSSGLADTRALTGLARQVVQRSS